MKVKNDVVFGFVTSETLKELVSCKCTAKYLYLIDKLNTDMMNIYENIVKVRSDTFTRLSEGCETLSDEQQKVFINEMNSLGEIENEIDFDEKIPISALEKYGFVCSLDQKKMFLDYFIDFSI